MIWKIAIRSIAAHPLRTAVLAGGFGFGIGVMAALLGVGEIILEQARSPLLRAGGDIRIFSPDGPIDQSRLILRELTHSPTFSEQVQAVNPRKSGSLYFKHQKEVVPLRATWSVPSLDKQANDSEVSQIEAWVDGPNDRQWSQVDASTPLREVDRFHPAPTGNRWDNSWAEWLYFNGKTENTRFYLTYLCGPLEDSQSRQCGIRLQWEGEEEALSCFHQISLNETELLETAPEIQWDDNSITIEEGRYHLQLALRDAEGNRCEGDLMLNPTERNAFPPYIVRGAKGWTSGYVIPVPQGDWSGSITLPHSRQTISVDDFAGYHDHNWGQWSDVTWQWGEISNEEVSVVYGKIFPPEEAVDPAYAPAILLMTLANGERSIFPNIEIQEIQTGDSLYPSKIVVSSTANQKELNLEMDVLTATESKLPAGVLFGDKDGSYFYQMKTKVQATIATPEFTSTFETMGSAETFRSLETGNAEGTSPNSN